MADKKRCKNGHVRPLMGCAECVGKILEQEVNKKGEMANRKPEKVNKPAKKVNKKHRSVTEPVTETPKTPALQGLPVGKKMARKDQSPTEAITAELPPEDIDGVVPFDPRQPTQKMESYKVVNPEPGDRCEMHSPRDIAKARAIHVREVAQKMCDTIAEEITDELFQCPETPRFQFKMESVPSDVKALVIQALTAAGWHIAYDGEETVEIGLPMIKPVATLAENRRSSVKPL